MKLMKADIRLKWQYRGCTIIPVDCQHPRWGKCGTPRDFGDEVSRNRYWRIEFPDESWVLAATKQECRDYVDRNEGKHGIEAV